MIKDGICTSAQFIEVRRWFNDKMTKWLQKYVNAEKGRDMIALLNDSHVYCREEDENGNPTGRWFRITGIMDFGPNVALMITKPNGKIDV